MSTKAVLLSLLLLPAATSTNFCQAPPDRSSEIAEHERNAQLYLRERNQEKAIPELEKVVALDPNNVDAQGNLGVLLFFGSRYKDAIPHLQAALAARPELAKIQGLLGISEARTSSFSSARKDMEAAFPLLQDKKFKVEVGLELVSLYTQSGELNAAPGVLTELRKTDPENAEVLYASYRTYADLSGEAMLTLSLAAPDSAQMHQIMAHEETRLGNTNGAIGHYRKAIALDPHLPGVHFELAELLNTSADVKAKQEAEQEYRLALAADLFDEKTEFKLAELDASKGNSTLAIEEYTKAVALQPADADAKLGLAKALLEMNETGKAQVLLEETVQLEPTNAVAHYRLGTLYRKLGRPEDSKREIELYKKYKDMKEKLRGIYKEMQITPNEIRLDDPDEK
jgi:tetratricopeptide (TPR) repeat protein